jgi:hypothetical protein
VLTPCRFHYNYDPNYECDGNHEGPEGRLTLHFYNDADMVNATLHAVLDGSHRNAGSTFDAFGIGISTMESMVGDNPNSTAKMFIDDVIYSGHRGLVNFNTDPGWEGVGNDRDGNNYGWVQEPGKIALATSHERNGISILPIGSRYGDVKPGEFPRLARGKKIAYAAGTFEYVEPPKTIGKGSQ